MAKLRYEPEGIYVGRDLYTWESLFKEFQKRVQIDPKVKIETLRDVRSALERAVYDSDMKRNRWGLWSGLKAALDYIITDLAPVYVILDGVRRDYLTYIDIEFARDIIVKGEPDLNPYVGRGALWRLGPFLASSGEPASQVVPELPAWPAPSARKDGASGDSGPMAPGLSAPKTPYIGPIAIPCSACSAGDTAMEFHDHDHVSIEDRRPAYPESITSELAKKGWSQ